MNEIDKNKNEDFNVESRQIPIFKDDILNIDKVEIKDLLNKERYEKLIKIDIGIIEKYEYSINRLFKKTVVVIGVVKLFILILDLINLFIEQKEKNDMEPWYKSRRILGMIFLVIATVLGFFGYNITEEMQNNLVDIALKLIDTILFALGVILPILSHKKPKQVTA